MCTLGALAASSITIHGNQDCEVDGGYAVPTSAGFEASYFLVPSGEAGARGGIAGGHYVTHDELICAAAVGTPDKPAYVEVFYALHADVPPPALGYRGSFAVICQV